jgi:hypothetical protein
MMPDGRLGHAEIHTDEFTIPEFPDNVSAAAISLTANSTAAINIKVTALMTPGEMDQAAQKRPG